MYLYEKKVSVDTIFLKKWYLGVAIWYIDPKYDKSELKSSYNRV